MKKRNSSLGAYGRFLTSHQDNPGASSEVKSFRCQPCFFWRLFGCTQQEDTNPIWLLQFAFPNDKTASIQKQNACQNLVVHSESWSKAWKITFQISNWLSFPAKPTVYIYIYKPQILTKSTNLNWILVYGVLRPFMIWKSIQNFLASSRCHQPFCSKN